MWVALVLVFLGVVTLLVLLDATRTRDPAIRLSVVVAGAAGVAVGADLARPWLPRGLLLVALALYLLGRRRASRAARAVDSRGARRGTALRRARDRARATS